ncbi:MAG: hypothetical protein U0793_00305 [Gemmataceae bacterium]
MRRAAFLIGTFLMIAISVSSAGEPAANPLDGKRFLSLEKLPGGDRADGTVNQIHWSVTFKGKSFSWHHYDKVLAGAYEFDAKTGAVKTGDGRIDASFDAKTGILTWGKHKYKAAK